MRERRLAVDQVYRAAYELLNGSVALRPGMNPSADPVVVKVYDEVPEQATQPYLVLGAAFELPDDQHDAYGSVVTFSVQPWSRYRGYAEVVSMLSQAAGALERQLPAVLSDWRHVTIKIASARTFRDPDPALRYGVLDVEVRLTDQPHEES